MTTNAHTHCPTCITAARDIVREGMIENIADDLGIDWDRAELQVRDADVNDAAIAYLDRIIAQQSNTYSTNPSNTCFFMH